MHSDRALRRTRGSLQIDMLQDLIERSISYHAPQMCLDIDDKNEDVVLEQVRSARDMVRKGIAWSSREKLVLQAKSRKQRVNILVSLSALHLRSGKASCSQPPPYLGQSPDLSITSVKWKCPNDCQKAKTRPANAMARDVPESWDTASRRLKAAGQMLAHEPET